jgi:hypothetical protein
MPDDGDPEPRRLRDVARGRGRPAATHFAGRTVVRTFRAIHTAVLKPDADPDAFERFMREEFLLRTRALPGCLAVQLLRGYHGHLPGVARARVDYAWISLWESVERNNAVWSEDGEHRTPESLREPWARLHEFAATVTLVGGFVVAADV